MTKRAKIIEIYTTASACAPACACRTQTGQRLRQIVEKYKFFSSHSLFTPKVRTVWRAWKELGNPCIGPNADKTFLSQSTYIFPVAGKEGAFIFMPDQWNVYENKGAGYVWLPIYFMDEWDWGVFNR